MRYVLSTYNFYPGHKGGTEVYTRNLADHLIASGHEVLIIAALDEHNIRLGPMLVVEGPVRAVKYRVEGLDILAISLDDQDRESVYANWKEGWPDVFEKLMSLVFPGPVDHLVMNGITTVSGRALMEALRIKGTEISIIAHTPFICPKADLINSFTLQRCTVRINPVDCSACMLKDAIGWPDAMIRLAEKFNHLVFSAISGKTVFHLRHLITTKIQGLAAMDSMVSHWVVFSEEMRSYLASQEFITGHKVAMVRHGIDKNVFFASDQRPQGKTIFLYAGRFEEIKGVCVLANAWNKTPQTEGRILYLAGNWAKTSTGDICRKILAHRKDVKWFGDLEQHELAALYKEVHAVVIPSTWVETGPMVFHEAIASGCDVIASDLGGQGELAKLYRERSITFPSGDFINLSKCLISYKFRDNRPDLDCQPMNIRQHFDQLMQIIN